MDASKHHLRRSRRLSFRSRVEFTRSLALLIGASLTTTEALKSIAGTGRDKGVAALALRLGSRVSRGISLSKAMSGEGTTFGQTYMQLVRVGEETGDLSTVLNRLVAHMDRSLALKRKVRAVMAYPIMIVFVAGGAVSFLMAFIVPSFATMYRDFGAELPGATQALLDISATLRRQFLWIAALLLLAFEAARRSMRKRAVKMFIARVVLRLPVFGNLVRESELCRLTGTLATMLEGGIPLADALRIIGRSSSNPLVGDEINRLAASVKKGHDLSKAATTSRLIPPSLTQLISVGEQGGTLAPTLAQASIHYNEEVEALVESISSLIEPSVILVLGLVLGAILIALYLPIFELSNVVG
jgi:type IV pilus assembly protein PilC